MEYKSPHDYLKSEYLRLNCQNDNIDKIDLDSYFLKARKKYGNNNKLYENDKSLFRKLQELADELEVPIKEQEKGSYWLLNRHSNNILEILRDNNIKVDKEIVLGTLPTQSFNAYASSFPDKKMLIVFNDGLITFIYLMGRIVSSLITKENKGGTNYTLHKDASKVEDILAENRISQSKFYETILLYKNNSLSSSRIFYETDANKGLSCCLYDTAELFITAHEYAHVLLGHLSHKKNVSAKSNKREHNFKETLVNWRDEMAADISAFKVILAYHNKKGYGAYAAFLSVEFLFSCLNLIEKIHNTDFSETHPNSLKRIEVIRNYFKNSYPINGDAIVKDCEMVSKLFEKLLNC